MSNDEEGRFYAWFNQQVFYAKYEAKEFAWKAWQEATRERESVAIAPCKCGVTDCRYCPHKKAPDGCHLRTKTGLPEGYE